MPVVPSHEDALAIVVEKKLTPAEITSLALYVLSIGLAFLTEDVSVRELSREQIADRAAKLFDDTAARLAERRQMVEQSGE